MKTKQFHIKKDGGGHMRPCGNLVQLLRQFHNVEFEAYMIDTPKNIVNPKSIMDLLTLRMFQGSTVIFSIDKEEHDYVFDKIQKVFDEFF